MLGTWVNIVATIDSGDGCKEQIEREVALIDSLMKQELSLFDKGSLLNRFNRSELIEPSEWMIYNIKLADSISRLSGGIYDITVAPLVRAYGFAAKSDAVESVNIDSLMEFVGYQKLTLNNGSLTKSDPRVQIDLNSIAKGFTVDVVAQMLESKGVENYLVEIGGEIRVNGSNPKGESWRVGIESPFMGNIVGGSIEQRVAIPDSSIYKCVATSGNYRRFHTNNKGERIVHTIDPLSGKPRESTLLSATVLAPNCALADGYATMLMAAGDNKAIELAEKIENCEVYLIFSKREDDEGYTIYSS